MKISKKLRKQLEKFLGSYPKYDEYGGFLFSYRDVVNEYMLTPNLSESPTSKFKPAEKAFETAKKYVNSKRGIELVAFWHSHPTPCIMSCADVTVANNPPYSNLIFVMITPKNDWYNPDCVWYAAKGTKPEEINFV